MQVEIITKNKPAPEVSSIPPAPAGAPIVPRQPEPGAPAAPSPEQVKEDTKNLYASMGWGEAPEEQAKPAASAPAAPAAPAVEEPATPDAPATPELEHEPAEPRAQDLIRETARETAREVADALRQSPTPGPSTPPFEMSPEDQADLRVLEFMAHRDQEKFGAYPQRFIDFVKARHDYEAKWSEENDGKEIPEDDADYLKWIDEHNPGIPVELIDEWKIKLMVHEEREREEEPKRRDEKARKAFETAIPKIAKNVDKNVFALINQVNPELLKVLIAEDGKPILTEETIKKLDEADPIAKEIIDNIVATELEPMILELEKTAIPALNYRLNPSSNQIHARLVDFIAQKEADLSKAPADVRNVDGKEFITIEQFDARAKQIRESKATVDEKRAQLKRLDDTTWSLGVDMIAELATDFCAKRAIKSIEKAENLAKRKYGSTKISGQTPSTQPAPAPAKPATQTVGKPTPPSLGTQSEPVHTVPASRPGEKSFGEIAVETSFPR